MAIGYTRQSTTQIVDGNIIHASDFNNEFQALIIAFDLALGHNHDGSTVGGGAPIQSVNGVSFPSAPSVNTVPVVTGSNVITYQTVPNAALTNPSFTLGTTVINLGDTPTTVSGLTINNMTSTGTLALNTVTLSGSATSTANITGGTYTNPTLVGTVSGPNPPNFDNSTLVASTAFVQQMLNGIITVPVGGNTDVTLTSSQYGAHTLILTGALTGNIHVIFPNLPGNWRVINETTSTGGPWTATIITLGGTGVVIPQNTSPAYYSSLFSDGTNMYFAENYISGEVINASTLTGTTVLRGPVTATGQTITNGTLSGTTLSGCSTSGTTTIGGAVTATGQTITGGTFASPTITSGTLTTCTTSGTTVLGGGVTATGQTITNGTLTGATLNSVSTSGTMTLGGGITATGQTITNGTINGAALANCSASFGFTLNTDITGNSHNINSVNLASSTIASTTTATTQSANDNSTKVATTAYADRAANNVFTGITTFGGLGTSYIHAYTVGGSGPPLTDGATVSAGTIGLSTGTWMVSGSALMTSSGGNNNYVSLFIRIS